MQHPGSGHSPLCWRNVLSRLMAGTKGRIQEETLSGGVCKPISMPAGIDQVPDANQFFPDLGNIRHT
jgi:hypothetical protein